MRFALILQGFVFFSFLLPKVSAETIKVNLEKFPPLIIDEKSGHSIDLMKEIEKSSDIKFDISITTYGRAKQNLSSKTVDLIAHTPRGLEEKDFYKYAIELDYGVETFSDLYVKDKKHLEDYKKLRFGVPIGNKAHHAEIMGVSEKQFIESDIDALVEMLDKGRIDAINFERSTVMNAIEKKHIQGVFYKQMPDEIIYASFAVQNNESGKALKKKLDDVIRKIDVHKVLGKYVRFITMPKSGEITLSK